MYTTAVSWWRHQMETFSMLLALCVGNSPATGEFPAQRPVTPSFDVFFDLRPNKRLSEQSWGWCFEMPLCSLWHHCNDNYDWATIVKKFWAPNAECAHSGSKLTGLHTVLLLLHAGWDDLMDKWCSYYDWCFLFTFKLIASIHHTIYLLAAEIYGMLLYNIILIYWLLLHQWYIIVIDWPRWVFLYRWASLMSFVMSFIVKIYLSSCIIALEIR